MKKRTQIAVYTDTGMKVINRVWKEAELEPLVTLRADVEVPLSRAEPTRGSLLAF